MPERASILLTERHAEQIADVLGCWDRMLIVGTLPKICFAGGMTSFLSERKIRIFDYPKFVEPFRNRIRETRRHWALAGRGSTIRVLFGRYSIRRGRHLLDDFYFSPLVVRD